MRIAPAITLSASTRRELEKLAAGRRVSVRLAERAAIVLHAADGLDNQQIAERLRITRQKAGRW
ncbi:MAG: helix-turn-helix domain-containing protein, partial [Planctomycetota bacterium]